MRPPARSAATLSLSIAAAWLGGCAVGPDYHRPPADLPASWHSAVPWHEAAPGDTVLKGRWWELFHDPALNPLVEKALDNNQTLKVAAARLDQAKDQLIAARSDLFPNVSLSASAERTKDSANRPLSAYSVPNQSTVQNDFRIGPSVNYEIDLFGRVRREVEGARASAAQAEADFENARLMLLATLVTDYFSLRETDAEIDVVRRSLDLEGDALNFVTARHDLGFATGLDLAQQQALLEASGTQLELLQNQRAQYEHALATLVGVPAPLFSLPPDATTQPLPKLPVGLPSDLLQRRPDVASAERAMAAANARIGVARAAYYPTIDLTPAIGLPNAGWESNALASLFEAPSRLWSIGLSASQTLFDAGKTRANVRFADADYVAAVATYRQTVLTAMEEVENGIAGLSWLDRASLQADAAVRSAQRAYEIATDRYKGGVDTYLDVITAQQTLLSDQRQAVQIQGQQFVTAVYLVKALGGGWSVPASPLSSSN
jgi:NodT family efflux transporter outer membrane factor (OMF) lipoprotein